MKRLAPILLLLSCSAPPTPNPVSHSGLDHAYWFDGTLISGAQPEGDAAYAALADLGVKTVISVDGAKPDAEAARRHGLRYVHLPVGYDGVSSGRARELAKAIVELPGPIYLHCHHGLHRGPAAAAVACVLAGRMTNDRAVETMRRLGTGEEYRGLYASAREARPADPAELRALKVEFRETAPVPPLTQSMVKLDEALGRVELGAKDGPRMPAHEVLQLRELCTELLRSEELKNRSDEFRSLMQKTELAARQLESGAAGPNPGLTALKKSCTDCHAAYRNTQSR